MDSDGLLQADLLAAILAPFAGLDPELGLIVEDASGRLIASAGPVAPTADPARATGGAARAPAEVPRASHEIRSGGRVIGRVTARGPGAATPAVAAGVEAIATALGALVDERQARTAAESALMEAGAEAAAERHRRIDDELALGRTIQRSFVGLVGPDIPGYDLACHYEQAAEVGGDFFDLFRPLRRGRPLSVVVADVTGKGVAAALLMAFARPVIHAAIDHARGPVDALERTNRVLRERRSSLFITALCGSLTLSTGRLRLANAGHEPPLIVRGDGSPIVPMEAYGSLLGAFPSLDLVEAVTDLAPGDTAVFYTDGVTDARSLTGERFEDARLLGAIEAARHGSAVDVVDSIRTAVETFQAGMQPADDITIVAIGRRARRRTGRAAAIA
ncbi:MAG: PP2C family protein-serine/threonine phosphatase [Chloroflexota bacterium]